MLRRLFTAILAILLLTTSCSVHSIRDEWGPQVCVPDHYPCCEGGTPIMSAWWQEFEDKTLNCWMDIALQGNFTVLQAWDRLYQAIAVAGIAGAPLYPQVEGSSGDLFEQKRVHDDGAVKVTNTPNYYLQGKLGYEVDLWNRLHSLYYSEKWRAVATLEDLEESAWLLTGVLTELWLSLHEQLGLEQVIREQIDVTRTFTELIDLRFSIGDSSALDVYQQRLQYEGTRAALPPVLSNLGIFKHQMYVLLGLAPHTCFELDIDPYLIDLPPFPDLGHPADLMWKRPDLRADFRRLVASDYAVAAAIADLFPKLNLVYTDRFFGKTLDEIVKNELWKIAADLVEPIFDGWQRRWQVMRRRAELSERLHRFSDRFIKAVQEVEDAILVEKYQMELIELIAVQLDLAEKNLREATIRYSNGLNDYLTVIVATQKLQALQRQRVIEHIRLLKARARLYRALGGTDITRELCR